MDLRISETILIPTHFMPLQERIGHYLTTLKGP